MELNLKKELKTPYYEQIAAQLRVGIIMHDLTDGSVLPSERALAAKLGIHRNTVIRAYKELQSAGLIESKQGIGYVVTLQEPAERVTIPAGEERDTMKAHHGRGEVNWPYLIKDEYLDVETTFDDLFSQSYSEDIISFAAGISAKGIYSTDELSEALEAAVEQGKRGQYYFTPYQGNLELRKELSTLLRERGIRANPGDIQIFSELNQALDFLLTMLIRPGDTVLTEEPLSPDVHRALDMAGAEQITVPMDRHGMFTDNLDIIIEKYRPKLIYINSSFHDPTGTVLSYERRKKLIEISQHYRIPIIEDDAASMLDYDNSGNPPLKAMDRMGNVIYIYSFELTFIPGINVAFVVAPRVVIQSLSYLVSLRLISLESIPQKLLAFFLKNGSYSRALAEMRRLYAKKRDLMFSMIEDAEIEGLYARKPEGGVYIWCHIPESVDVDKLASEAAKRGVTFIPGHIFYRNGKQPDNYIRLNYSAPSEEEISKGMRILLDTIAEMKKSCCP